MQAKKAILAIICLTVLWSLMDFVVHGQLLSSHYQATAHLWRPLEEMNHLVQLIMTFVFACLYVLFYLAVVQVKTLSHGVKFGVCYGLISGFGMFGMTSYMPIPMSIGAAWFAACFVQSIVAGAVMGYITKE
jgi:hypothetical protein